MILVHVECIKVMQWLVQAYATIVHSASSTTSSFQSPWITSRQMCCLFIWRCNPCGHADHRQLTPTTNKAVYTQPLPRFAGEQSNVNRYDRIEDGKWVMASSLNHEFHCYYFWDTSCCFNSGCSPMSISQGVKVIDVMKTHILQHFNWTTLTDRRWRCCLLKKKQIQFDNEKQLQININT